MLQARERQAKSALKLERREAKSAVMTYLTIIVAPAALHGTPWRVGIAAAVKGAARHACAWELRLP